jgi:hypothetical protein
MWGGKEGEENKKYSLIFISKNPPIFGGFLCLGGGDNNDKWQRKIVLL